MARQVRVASRALRRGRRLRPRASEVPPAADAPPADVAPPAAVPSSGTSAEARGELDEEPAVPTPDTRRLEAAAEAEGTKDRQKDRFARPAAPNLDLFGASSDAQEADDEHASERELEAVDAEPPARDDALDSGEDSVDAAGDDALDSGDDALDAAGDAANERAEVQAAVGEDVPAPRVSAYSRPPAPSLDFGASDDEPESQPDPNATTLISREGPRPSRPSQSPVSVVDAADEGVPSLLDAEADLDFVPEDDEPPISAQASSADGEPAADGKFFRQSEATLAPVVDEVDPLSEGPLEPTLLSPAEASRRRTLRRVVGVGVIAAGLLTLGLVAKSAMTDEQPAAGERSAPAAEVATEAEPEAAPAKVEPKVEAAAVAPSAAVGATVPEDYDEVEKQTLELLNDRKFEAAIPFAEKLIQLKPESAFGYRCLGSALQDLGRQADAQKIYSDCATNATKGEVLECTALGGYNKNIKK